MTSDSAERRAQRKLAAEAYKYLPSRETLQAATQLEHAKMERATREEQLAVQKGSLAVAVLSQLPRDNEDNKPIFVAARELLLRILKQGFVQLQEAEDEEGLEDDEAMEGGPGAE